MKQLVDEQLSVVTERFGKIPCLHLRGEGDRNGAQLLIGALNELLAGHDHLAVVDTRHLRFLDPSCCQVLEIAANRFRERGGQLVVVDPSLPVERTLKLLDIEHQLPVLPTIPQALELLEKFS